MIRYAAQNRRARRLVGTSVRRNPAAGKAVTKTVLAKGPGGYGLRFGGPKNTEEGEKFGFGIFIAGKKEGGVAESNADIRVNEQLLKVRGKRRQLSKRKINPKPKFNPCLM